jgi:hypothetical protein
MMLTKSVVDIGGLTLEVTDDVLTKLVSGLLRLTVHKEYIVTVSYKVKLVLVVELLLGQLQCTSTVDISR